MPTKAPQTEMVPLRARRPLYRAGARYRDAAKKRKSFACNLSAGRALTSFRRGVHPDTGA